MGCNGRLTIYTVEDTDGMKDVAADGAGISLLGPRADARIVDDVVAAIEGSDNVEMACGLVGLGLEC